MGNRSMFDGAALHNLRHAMVNRPGRGRVPIFISALMFLAAVPPEGAAAPYTFVSVADTTGPYKSVRPLAAIDDQGTVAFSASLDTGGNGIFIGPDPTSDAVAGVDGAYELGDEPSFGASGTVAFFALLRSGGSGFFTGPDPSTDTVVSTTGGAFTQFGSFLALNSLGGVAFTATAAGGSKGVFTGPDPVVDLVANTDGPFSDFSSTVAMNDGGLLAFYAQTDSGGMGIFSGPDASADAIATTDGPFAGFGAFPSLNNSGERLIFAHLDNGNTGLFRGYGSGLDVFVDDSGAYAGFGNRHALNDAGDVLFFATLDGGGLGLFSGPDPTNDRVIASNDPLFGSTVAQLAIGSQSLNSRGDVAFWYSLSSGTSGIGIALVPELPPSILLSLILAGLSLAKRCRVKLT